MRFYRKYDLVKIISSFQLRFDEEFNYSPDKKEKLLDIFYVTENKITVNNEIQEGYTIIFYFRNGVSLTPLQFYTLNGIDPAGKPYPAVQQTIG